MVHSYSGVLRLSLAGTLQTIADMAQRCMSMQVRLELAAGPVSALQSKDLTRKEVKGRWEIYPTFRAQRQAGPRTSKYSDALQQFRHDEPCSGLVVARRRKAKLIDGEPEGCRRLRVGPQACGKMVNIILASITNITETAQALSPTICQESRSGGCSRSNGTQSATTSAVR